MSVIAQDPEGNLRDPSSVVQAPDGTWHFWVGRNVEEAWFVDAFCNGASHANIFTALMPCFMQSDWTPADTQPGWGAYLRHYQADNITGVSLYAFFACSLLSSACSRDTLLFRALAQQGLCAGARHQLRALGLFRPV